MTSGIGIDIIEVDRIEKRIGNESGFREFIFHPSEIEYCESKTNKYEHYAARFAAKEALLKALGTGLNGGLVLNEVAVVNDKAGKPEFNFYHSAFQLMESKGKLVIHLSLSHLKSIAIGMVVIEMLHDQN